MKKNLIQFFVLVAIFNSCKKEETTVYSNAAITVVNAIVEGVPVSVSTNSKDSVLINSSKSYGFAVQPSTKISVFASRTPSLPYFTSETLQVNKGDIYSLFVCGRYPSGEAMLVKESLKMFSDSVISVRFINLSPSSIPINVTLSGTPSVNQFSNVAYKQITDFKQLAAGPTVANTVFTFQVRNASTHVVIATYAYTAANLTASRFRNVTLVFRGIIGGTGTSALGITFVPHY